MFNWSESLFMSMILAGVGAYVLIIDWTCRRLVLASAELRLPID